MNAAPEPVTIGAALVNEAKRCGCCGESYDDPNDLAVFGVLDMVNGGTWLVCGPCIQVMWQERGFRPEVIPV